MMKKVFVSVALAAIIAIFFSAPSFAANSTSAEFVIGMNQYFVDNQTPGTSMDAAPYIDSASGRAMVPVRYLGDALGATTSWGADTQAVTVNTSVYIIQMAIGSTTLTVNGQAQTLDQAPVIKNGRTYLPARWVANALGYQVDWNAQYQVVIIWPNGTTEPTLSSDVIKQASQEPTVVNGFTIPAGTKLTLDNSVIDNTEPMAFTINTKNGDVQGQLADAQNILSQAKFLDPATVSKVMAVINGNIAGTMNEDGYINSSNGGGVDLSVYGNWWFNIQMSTKPAPAGSWMLK